MEDVFLRNPCKHVWGRLPWSNTRGKKKNLAGTGEAGEELELPASQSRPAEARCRASALRWQESQLRGRAEAGSLRTLKPLPLGGAPGCLGRLSFPGTCSSITPWLWWECVLPCWGLCSCPAPPTLPDLVFTPTYTVFCSLAASSPWPAGLGETCPALYF